MNKFFKTNKPNHQLKVGQWVRIKEGPCETLEQYVEFMNSIKK